MTQVDPNTIYPVLDKDDEIVLYMQIVKGQPIRSFKPDEISLPDDHFSRRYQLA